MKITSHILTIFLFFMVLLPCNDTVYASNFKKDSITQVEKQSTDKHSNHQDDCTPLCSCNCCSKLVTISSILIFKDVENTVYSFNNYNYNFIYSYKFTKGIWHPPLA